MSPLQAIRVRVSKSLKAIHNDERGINTIEIVLILCAAAVILTLAYKLLWGQEGNKGVVWKLFDSVWTNYNTGLNISPNQGPTAPAPTN